MRRMAVAQGPCLSVYHCMYCSIPGDSDTPVAAETLLQDGETDADRNQEPSIGQPVSSRKHMEGAQGGTKGRVLSGSIACPHCEASSFLRGTRNMDRFCKRITLCWCQWYICTPSADQLQY